MSQDKYLTSNHFSQGNNDSVSHDTKLNKSKIINPNSVDAIDFYQKLCLRSYSTPNPSFINLLKGETLNLYLDNYTIKEINSLSKTLDRFCYFKTICLTRSEPSSK